DLPAASVAIQVSGAFGSRQEEAQRLGRILRPKEDQGSATFYTVVAADTVDEHFAAQRRRFLTEQGYGYSIEVRVDRLAEQGRLTTCGVSKRENGPQASTSEVCSERATTSRRATRRASLDSPHLMNPTPPRMNTPPKSWMGAGISKRTS